MDYIKIRFGDDIGRLTSKVEKAFENVFRPRPANPMFSSSECTWNPQMDIYETPEEIIVLAEIAGVDKQNLEVEISPKAIRISGKREPMLNMKNATYRLAELQYGDFERILFLPTLVDTDNVKSSYENGLLEITLQKRKEAKARKIPISGSDD